MIETKSLIAASQKPTCYSPSRVKSPVEMAENCCDTCPESPTCLAPIGAHTAKSHLRPILTRDQIIEMAIGADLVYQGTYGTIESPWKEGTDIEEYLIKFAEKLLFHYENAL